MNLKINRGCENENPLCRDCGMGYKSGGGLQVGKKFMSDILTFKIDNL